MTFKLFSLVMAVLIFSMPCITFAQYTNDVAQAIAHAKNDVNEPFGWFAGSFLTSVAFGCLGGFCDYSNFPSYSRRATNLPING